MNSALSHAKTIRRDLLDEAKRRREIDVESAKIAAVDADQVAARIQGAFQFIFCMGLAQNIQIVSVPLLGQHLQLWILKRRDNQQDGIRPMRPRLKNLRSINDEVFAQAGKASCIGSLHQIGQRSLKKFLVREH